METPWYLIAVTSVIASTVGAFLGAYLNEKAKNLATREDIDEITEKIETVKAEISFASQQRLSIKEKERETLMTFTEDCFDVLHTKIGRDVFRATLPDKETFIRHPQTVNAIFAKIRIDYNKILCFFPLENEVQLAAKKVVDSSLLVRDTFNGFFPRTSMLYLSSLNSLEKVHASPAPDSTLEEEYKEKESEARKGIDNYASNMNYSTEVFDRALDEFTEVVRNYFESIGKPQL